MSDPVRWPDQAEEVISGDMTVAAAYITPAGRAVVTAVSTMGTKQRDAGVVGFTTSLGFARKLDPIIREPRVALAYHAREHHDLARPERFRRSPGNRRSLARPGRTAGAAQEGHRPAY